MKKILILTSNFPKPLNNGGKLRDYYIIEYLSRNFDVSIAGLKENSLKPKDVFLPFVPASKCHIVEEKRVIDIPTFWDKRYWPYWCLLYYAEELKNTLDDLIQKDHFDYIYVFCSYMAHFVLKYKNIVRVIDHHNVKTSLYQEALSRTDNIINKINYKAEYYKWYKYEREVLGHFELHTACSAIDQELIRAFVKTPVVLLPSGVDIDRIHPKKEENTGYNILFTGTLNYFPNYEAIRFFCKKVLPIIRRSIPNVVFQVVGREPTKALEALLKNTPNTWSSFNVRDIRPYYYQSSVFVVPIYDGGGTRLKIMEAMATGLPVVSTSKGCEGLGLKQGEGIVITDEPEDLAGAVISLLTDHQKQKEFQQKALEVAKDRFDWDKVLRPLETIFR